MSSMDSDFNQNFEDAIDVIQQHSNNSYYDSDFPYYETLKTVPQTSVQRHIADLKCCLVPQHSDVAASTYVWSDTTQQPWTPVLPEVPCSLSLQTESSNLYAILPPQNSKGRKKVRLYEYLHQALSDPNMCDTIQWTDSSSGTFHFISKNKEKLAECWGQRKGNRKTMTYQKMARALRNYSRTGEIIKVRRKLTYQFNPDILHRLSSSQVNMPLTSQPPPSEEPWSQHQHHSDQSYSTTADWHGWCGPYPLPEDYNLCSSYTSQSSIKSWAASSTDK